ncbi:hypothetical protein KAJ38_02145 [Candidatus Pacearchaeota archaeon]|nr:hypothetical protein [Candidatus Pacearchaeota archaeon]
MKKLMKKKVNMFGKEFSVFALVMVAMVTFASAALLTYYGSVTGLVTASQSVLVDGQDYNTPISNDYNVTAGGSVSDCGHDLKNHAEIPADVSLATTCASPTETTGTCAGVTTEVYGILELTKKTKSAENVWTPTGAKIKISYTVAGGAFSYNMVEGIIPVNYELVYAMDKQDRFDPANYATVFKLGELPTSDLPVTGDWNAGGEGSTANYCGNDEGDNYLHCTGAKLWVVKSSDIATTKEGDGSYRLSYANMANYYWETDLIVHSTDDIITLPANGGGFNFCVDSEFALALVPDTYTITTKVNPVL